MTSRFFLYRNAYKIFFPIFFCRIPFFFYTYFPKKTDLKLHFFQYTQIRLHTKLYISYIYSFLTLCIQFLCIQDAIYVLLFSTKKNTAEFFSPPYFPFYFSFGDHPAAERQKTDTSLAPARYRTLAHSLQVLPVVKISSTKRIRFPVKSAVASKASFRFFRRSSGVRRVLWATVSRFRRRPSFRKTSPVFSDIFRQRIWVWLKPLHFSLLGCRGTDKIMSVCTGNSSWYCSKYSAINAPKPSPSFFPPSYLNRWIA